MTEQELLKRKANFDVVDPLVEDFERLQVEFAEVNEKLRVLEDEHALLKAWKVLPIKLSQLETSQTKTFLVQRLISLDKKSLKQVFRDQASRDTV